MLSLLGQLAQLGSLFGGVATAEPLSSVLLALGAVLTGGSLLFLAYLVLGAVARLFTPSPSGPTHRPGA